MIKFYFDGCKNHYKHIELNILNIEINIQKKRYNTGLKSYEGLLTLVETIMNGKNNPHYNILAMQQKLKFYRFVDAEQQKSVQLEISEYLNWIFYYFKDLNNAKNYFYDYTLIYNIMKFSNDNQRADISRLIYDEATQMLEKTSD